MYNDQAATAFPPADDQFQHPAEPGAALARWAAAACDVPVAALIGDALTLHVVVPHADDETLGCGGLIAAAADAGMGITVTILTDGAASHPGSRRFPAARLARRRQLEARLAVAQLAGLQARVNFLAAPDGDLASVSGLEAQIADADLFVTCWQGDPHPDHRAAFAIALAVAVAFDRPLLAFPLWALTTDAPVPELPIVRIDIDPWRARKAAALAAHQSQLGQLIDDVPGFVIDAPLHRLFMRADEMFVRVRQSISHDMRVGTGPRPLPDHPSG